MKAPDPVANPTGFTPTIDELTKTIASNITCILTTDPTLPNALTKLYRKT